MSTQPPTAEALWLQACEQLGIAPPESSLATLLSFLDGVLEVGRVHNVTGIKDPVEAWNVLVLQSLVFLPELVSAGRDGQPVSVVDIGSGAGVPAVPLAVAGGSEPGLVVTAVECRGKKAETIASAARELGLGNLTVLSERAEDLGRSPATRESFDVAVMRAVGSLAEVLEYGLPLVRVGGRVLVAKSLQQLDEEIPAGRRAARLLGGDDPRVECVQLLGRKTALVVVAKLQQTPKAYPRRAGSPRQSPLGT